MCCNLLRRYLLIIACFIIYIQNVCSVNIPIKRSYELKTGKSINAKYRKSGITEEQRSKLNLWPRGVVQYFIDDFSFDKVLRDKIRTVLDDVSTKTAESLQFLELPSPPTSEQERWVLFINRVGQLECADCSPANFTEQGVQRILLGYDCLNEGGGGLAALVLALAGVPPQHNAPNRNDYIAILDNNILPDKKHLFKIVPESNWVFSSFDYDFASASHYDFYKYTSNGQATIKPMDNVEISVGEATGLSPIDIAKISFLYKNSKADVRPGMQEECSKLYVGQSQNNQKLSNVIISTEKEKKVVKSLPPVSRGAKRGLKQIIEKGSDFDTDTVDRDNFEKNDKRK